MTEETPIQDKQDYGFPTDAEDYEWKEVEKATAEKAFHNMNRDLLYVEDTYSNGTETTQTDFDDWEQDRYEVKLRRQYQPMTDNGKTIHTSMDWQETNEFLNGITE